jgi:hypothetical protein
VDGGPPFSFVFRRIEHVSPELRKFAETVSELARDSVEENGGQVTYEK